MSTEAHKLIGISLSKIAQSRASRGGVSLHKNLLVATVLHKARYIFMEEAYQIVHSGSSKSLMSENIQDASFDESQLMKTNDDGDDNSVVVNNDNETTVEMATNNDKFLSDISDDEWPNNENEQDNKVPEEVEVTNDDNMTKTPPPSYQAHIEFTYLNLDKCNSNNNTAEQRNNVTETNNNIGLKRRHSEWGEIEEAVLSILPKKSKSFQSEQHLDEINSTTVSTNTSDDFTFLDESDFLSESNKSLLNQRTLSDPTPLDQTSSETDKIPAMEIDRLSSLVSIFSFANLADISGGSSEILDNNKTHSVTGSSDHQCSTQAKDNSDVLQQLPPFLAMTV